MLGEQMILKIGESSNGKGPMDFLYNVLINF